MAVQPMVRRAGAAQRADEASADDVRTAGFLFILLGAAFVTVTMLAASIAPHYDFRGGAISDLGVIGETALLFNGLLVGLGGSERMIAYPVMLWMLALGGFLMTDRTADAPR